MECSKQSNDCSKSAHGPIGSWDVSDVANMWGMFNEATWFNHDLSKWDVSRVTIMGTMFYSASSFNGDLSKWDVSRVTDMYSMFNRAKSFNGDLSKWDVSRVTDMQYMFVGAESFVHTLCGAWLASTANKDGMFYESSGRICLTTSKRRPPPSPTQP